MMEEGSVPRSPPGTSMVAGWAASRGLPFEPFPDERWFRAGEPFDVLVAPSRYVNAVWVQSPPGLVALVEPWTASDDGEPLDRTVLGFAAHPGLRFRAAARAGESFLTRVSFLDGPKPRPQVLGDAEWDAHVATFGRSAEEAALAFPPGLRRMLAEWRFRGHVEAHVGGVILHVEGLQPSVDGYRSMRRMVVEVVNRMLGW